jgi:hypothetical protein
MPTSKKVALKRGPGRPATGRDPMIGGRVPQETIVRVDDWAKANGLTRSSALAPLLDAGLKQLPKVNPKG